MDPVKQALLGSACSQSVLQGKLHNWAVNVGACSARAPDLNIFISSSNDPLMPFFTTGKLPIAWRLSHYAFIATCFSYKLRHPWATGCFYQLWHFLREHFDALSLATSLYRG